MLNMNNYQEIDNVKEIELKKLFLTLWRGKWFTLLCCIICIFFASMHLQNAARSYSVEYKLKPVGETKQKSSLSGLGGIVSFAGIQLPSNTTNDFLIFKKLISSTEVSEVILKNKKLIKEIYADEWNSSLNIFSEPPKSKLRIYIGALKKILTGNKEVNYMPPNARRLAMYISEIISIKEDNGTGFLTIKAETSNPDLLLSLISEAIEASDKIMRQRYINFSKEPLEFYKEKLRTSRSREHREVLAELIAKEEQKLMFASQGKYFIAEPYLDPKISLYPTTPKPKQVLLLSLILGLFAGFAISILTPILRDNK